MFLQSSSRTSRPSLDARQNLAFALHRTKNSDQIIQKALREMDVTDIRNWAYMDAVLAARLLWVDDEEMPKPVSSTSNATALYHFLKQFQVNVKDLEDLHLLRFPKESDWPKTVTIRKRYVKAIEKINQVSDRLKAQLSHDAARATVPLWCMSSKNQRDKSKYGKNIPNTGHVFWPPAQLQIPGLSELPEKEPNTN